MSKLFIGFLSAAQLAAIHDAGHIVEAFALSEPQKLVATLKGTSIGATVSADISALKGSTLTGVQKFEQVVANTAPLIMKYVAGGPSAIITDAADIARELVQSLYNDLTGAVKAAATAVAGTPTPAAPPAPAPAE